MISRTDLYIEKLIARMNLDDTQRVEVERELRAHLDEAVQSGVAGGLTEQQAEEEALLRFGQPSVLARHFGAVHGTVWLVFEKLAMAVLVYWGLGGVHLHGSVSPWARQWLQVIGAILCFGTGTWDRVAVNGTLRVYRFLRPTVSIPFEAIRKVQFAAGHLCGHRALRIDYDGGCIRVSSGLRNFRCASIAIEALAPQALQDGTTRLTDRLRLGVRSESNVFRWGFTIAWAVIFVCYLAVLRPLVKLQGIPYVFVFAALGAEVLVWWQAYRHVDRAKRGITALLLIAWHVYIVNFAMSFIFWSEPYRLWAVAVFPVAVGLFILQLWWRWSRRNLLLCVAATLVGTMLANSAIVRGSRSLAPRVATAPVNVMHGAILPSNDRTYLALGYSMEPQVANSDASMGIYSVPLRERDATPCFKQLPSGDWCILGPLTTDTMALAREYPPNTSSSGKTFSEIYITSGTGDMARLAALPQECSWSYAQILRLPFFSPDRTYVLAPVTSETIESGKKTSSQRAIGFMNMKTGVLTQFKTFEIGAAWRWADDAHLLAIKRIRAISSLNGSKKAAYRHEVWVLNARTGEALFQRELVLANKAMTFSPWFSGRYALSDGQIVDLETGKGILMPGYDDQQTRDWQPDAGMAACVSTEGGSEKVMVYGPDGPKASYSPPRGAVVELIKISPEGNRAFVTYKERPDLLFPSTTVVLLDLISEQPRVIERMAFYSALMMPLNNAGAGHTPLQWTPEGQVVYPVLSLFAGRTGTTGGYQLRIAADARM